jgi:hypothetical protein
LRAIQRLDLGFFVKGQDYGMGGRIDIKSHHIAQLLGKAFVIRELELPYPMGLEPVFAPNALD